MKKHVYSVGRG